MSITSITSTTQPPAPPHGGPPRTPPALSGTASLLGLSADELRDAQRSGTTPADLAAQKGVSKDDLVKSIAADLEANKPEGAPALSATQLTEMATGIAEGRRPDGPPPPPPGQGGDGQERVQLNAASLAEALGTDVETLLQRLRSGEDVGALLRAPSATAGYGSTAGDALRGGLAGDRYA
jgi:hypothetical protein